jgi:peptide/nickel transport system permease protein
MSGAAVGIRLPKLARPRVSPRWILRLLPLIILVLVAVLAPLLERYSPTMVVGKPNQSPNAAFWFGTDPNGYDVYSRTLAATSLNLRIGAMVAILTTVVGIVVGLAIGMNESKRGPIGSVARGLARVVDLTDAIPVILVGIVALSLFGAKVTTLIVAISVILVPLQARLVRTETLRVRSEAYLDAARLGGLSEAQLTVRHVLPNASWPALGNASVIFGLSCILTASLGFLGVGLRPPTPEWGSMIAAGVSLASTGQWWASGFPALALALAVVAVAHASRAVFGRGDGAGRVPRPAGTAQRAPWRSGV